MSRRNSPPGMTEQFRNRCFAVPFIGSHAAECAAQVVRARILQTGAVENRCNRLLQVGTAAIIAVREDPRFRCHGSVPPDVLVRCPSRLTVADAVSLRG